MAVGPVVVALSASGEAVAHRVAAAIGASVHGRAGRVADADAYFPDALVHVRDLFAGGVPIVGVCAAGILIRAVAPLLGDKRAEPPVVAVSEDGEVAVPLLGGHRGANRLAAKIAENLGGTAALTTAGEVALGVALDAPPPGWRLATPELAREAMASLLAGDGARVSGQADWLDSLPAGDGVSIHAAASPVPKGALGFHPQVAALGVGCARDCPPEELAALVAEVLVDAGVAAGALAGVFTLDLKADEPAVNALARNFQVPLKLFEAKELDAENRVENPSDVVFSEVGTHSVAEAAALLGAGPQGRLAVPKRKTAQATAALALSPMPITTVAGRPRGRLAVVGIGPGQSSWRTPEASRLIAEAGELVGYGLYLDLLGPVAAGKTRADFPLGGEEARCRYALERAGAGHSIALVCSGDAGIYAMGALVFELLDRGSGPTGVSASARRAEIVCAPGVSAMQAAAARAGAPLGHDFCAISLSDLLTPRTDILRRVRAAAEGDFVVAFYNPVSRTRRTLLAEARRILLEHRPADTPVILGTSIGRPDESIVYRSLEDLDVDEVDMLTLVIVGSRMSRLARLGEGPRMYTPRGYSRKFDRQREHAGMGGGPLMASEGKCGSKEG